MSVAYFFAFLTGFVVAGFVSSLWALVTGRALTFGILGRSGWVLPLDVAVVTVSFPLLLAKTAVKLTKTRQGGFLALGAFSAAIICSFFQGVVLLSVIYNM